MNTNQHIEAAWRYARFGDFAFATSVLEDAKPITDAEDQEVRLQLAHLLFRSGQFREALTLSEQSPLAKGSKRDDALFLSIASLLELAEYSLALDRVNWAKTNSGALKCKPATSLLTLLGKLDYDVLTFPEDDLHDVDPTYGAYYPDDARRAARLHAMFRQRHFSDLLDYASQCELSRLQWFECYGVCCSCITIGRNAEARPFLERAKALFPAKADLTLLEAICNKNDRRYSRSIELISSYLQRRPLKVAAYGIASQVYLKSWRPFRIPGNILRYQRKVSELEPLVRALS